MALGANLMFAVKVAPAETTIPSTVTVLYPAFSVTSLNFPGTRPTKPNRPDFGVM